MDIKKEITIKEELEEICQEDIEDVQESSENLLVCSGILLNKETKNENTQEDFSDCESVTNYLENENDKEPNMILGISEDTGETEGEYAFEDQPKEAEELLEKDENSDHLNNIKTFQCPECDYSSNQRYILKRHMIVHSNLKIFNCIHCNYSCNRKTNLNKHLLIHSETKLFKCNECEFACNEKQGLVRHMLIHSKTKLHKCNQCEYACNRKEYLTKHMLSHNNINLFQCSECSYACNYKHSLSRHMLTHKY
ncbi:Zinc finger protein [Armadillidium nasatum]|uniref:Zinc finger protein n=1 Tax=Armadillidium nasatum TaxID=96803 RepID=A0A5N5TAS4_9CRUS|nr:Zinc finger protein [Armadillidium nasatum]